MKKELIFAAIMIASLGQMSFAQIFTGVPKLYTAKEKERFEMNYVVALESNNKGLVESALAVATLIKINMPEEEFPLLRAKIMELANSEIPSIHYKASLAKAAYENPNAYQQEAQLTYDDPNEFFSALDATPNQTSLISHK